MSRTRPNDQFTEYSPPWVEEIEGEPFRYRVESQSGAGFHTVDLTEREGHGRCSCKDFEIRAVPNFKRHGQHIPYSPGRAGCSECKHLAAAFHHLHLHCTQPMLASFKAGVTKPKP